jgi:hypothetical protein
MRDKPKGEIIEGFYRLSMHLLIQLVKERGVDGHELVRLAARRTLGDLRENTPGKRPASRHGSATASARWVSGSPTSITNRLWRSTRVAITPGPWP